MKIMVSACLIGEKCKYNGKDNYNEKVVSYINGNDIIPVCPELAGGLAVPRYPCEIVGGHILDSKGQNLDIEFNEGSLKCVKIATEEKIDIAILQSRSPSCGVNQIYDGSFSGKLISGNGVFAEMLKSKGFKVIDAEDL